jgi:MAF protein
LKSAKTITSFDTLILGSTSPFRKEQLEKLHIPFECASPNCDETPLENERPQQLVERLSIKKAQSLAKDFPNHLIIGSDQVAVCQKQILGKPHTHENAVKQLLLLSGELVRFYTGLCLYNSNNKTFQVNIIPFEVQFRQLSKMQINNYLHIDKPYNCAGSFKSEAMGISLFESMTGNDPTALIGLPLIQLTSMLANEGIILPLKS